MIGGDRPHREAPLLDCRLHCSAVAQHAENGHRTHFSRFPRFLDLQNRRTLSRSKKTSHGQVSLVSLLVCVSVVAVAAMFASVPAIGGNAPTVGQIGAPSVYDVREEAGRSDSLWLDDQRVEVRAPSDERMAEYEKDDAYNYERDAPPDEGTGIMQWLLSQLIDLLQSSETSRTITEIVIYALVAVAIGYGLLTVIRMEPRSKRRTSGSGYRADGLEERVKDTEFEPLIDRAMQDGDYRSAIRLMYLHGLQKLDREGRIEWAPDRTNRQYARDLSGTDLREPFREATRIFDIVWYGDVDVSESDVRRLRPPFDQIREEARASLSSSASQNDLSESSSSSSSSSSAGAGGESR